MSIVLTGGAGHIGSHLVRRLREEGVERLVVDNLGSGHRELVKRSQLEAILQAAWQWHQGLLAEFRNGETFVESGHGSMRRQK